MRTGQHPALLASALVLTTLPVAPALSCQQADAVPPELVVQIDAREGWLHGRQNPGFTRLPEVTRRIFVDSIRGDMAEGDWELFLSLDYQRIGDRARIRQHRSRPPPEIRAILRERRPISPGELPEAYARFAHTRWFEGGDHGRLALPEMKVWDLVPTIHEGALEAGGRWVEPIDLAAEHGKFRQAIWGSRISTVEGDTLIEGRRLWIVRDSAEVRYEERLLQRERTLDTLVVVERRADGVITGRHVYDPGIRLFRTRKDTAVLAGEAVLRYPDGRSFRTPATFERERRWTVCDAEDHERRIDQRWAEARGSGRGMLLLPGDRIEERLSGGDGALRDSLILEWHESGDPDERDRLRRVLRLWTRPGDELEDRFARLSLEAGDTTAAVVSLRSVPRRQRPLTVEELELLLPFMDDPGLAFAFGLSRDGFYEDIRESLLRAPPAITPDSSRWACTMAACRLLGAQRLGAREPRLRDLALTVNVVMDPAGWNQDVRRRFAEGSVFLEPVVQLLNGVGATWPAASNASLPSPEEDWRAWLEWMNGRDPRYGPHTGTNGTPVRFGETHVRAIRFHEMYTGRDVAHELRRKNAAAAGDSARLVYGTILLGLGEVRRSPEDVAAALRTGSPEVRTLALRELRDLFHDVDPAEDDVAIQLTDRLLSIVIEGTDPWPPLDMDEPRDGRGPRQIATEPVPVIIRSDHLPPEVAWRWADRASLMSDAAMEDRSDRLPGIIFHTSRVLRAGPLVRLGVSYSTRMERAADQAPAGHAGGITVYLMEDDNGWRLVSSSEWIT